MKWMQLEQLLWNVLKIIMIKTSQSSPTLPELIILRNSIVKFHQNMKIAFNKLKTSASQGVIQQALLEAYKSHLENIAAASVFGSKFTTAQMKQHLRYLEGILKKFASVNAMSQNNFAARYVKQPYYQNIFYLGNKIKELFTPAATGIKSNLSDGDLIKNAKNMANLLDKTGANLVTKITSYLNGLTPSNNLGRVLTSNVDRISINKLAYQIEIYFNLTQ